MQCRHTDSIFTSKIPVPNYYYYITLEIFANGK